jgi:hypothetical protein
MTLVATPGIAANGESANELLPGCKRVANPNSTASMDGAYCAGLVDGVVSMATIMNYLQQKSRHMPCFSIPKGVTLRQQMSVVIRFIEARPTRMHEGFYLLAMEALEDAWPCREGIFPRGERIQ